MSSEMAIANGERTTRALPAAFVFRRLVGCIMITNSLVFCCSKLNARNVELAASQARPVRVILLITLGCDVLLGTVSFRTPTELCRPTNAPNNSSTDALLNCTLAEAKRAMSERCGCRFRDVLRDRWWNKE